MRLVLVGIGSLGLGVSAVGGTRQFEPVLLDLAPTGVASSATITDTDGDGRNELLVVTPSWGQPGDLEVYALAADGSAALEATIGLPSPGAGIWGVQPPKVVDVDGDGDADIVVYMRSKCQRGKPHVLAREGAGWALSVFDTPETDASFTFAIGDIDGDGLPDVVSGDLRYATPKKVFVTYNAPGSDRFTRRDTYPMPFNGGPDACGFYEMGVVHVYATDLDGDGDVDVAVSTHPYSPIAARLLFNDGSGRLATAVDLPGVPTIDLGFADLDGDGSTDVIADASPGSQCGDYLRVFARSGDA